MINNSTIPVKPPPQLEALLKEVLSRMVNNDFIREIRSSDDTIYPATHEAFIHENENADNG